MPSKLDVTFFDVPRHLKTVGTPQPPPRPWFFFVAPFPVFFSFSLLLLPPFCSFFPHMVHVSGDGVDPGFPWARYEANSMGWLGGAVASVSRQPDEFHDYPVRASDLRQTAGAV